METYRVIGEALGDDGRSWHRFEDTVEAESREQARWAIRRQYANGEPGPDIEELPPNAEREAVEIEDEDEPRTAARSAEEDAEYDRLVNTVRILAVLAPGEDYEEDES